MGPKKQNQLVVGSNNGQRPAGSAASKHKWPSKEDSWKSPKHRKLKGSLNLPSAKPAVSANKFNALDGVEEDDSSVDVLFNEMYSYSVGKLEEE